MERLFASIVDALSRGEDVVLCSVISSSGSTPRGSGAKMAVFPDGSARGTIGGGTVEFESIKLAGKALKERSAFCQGFNLAPNQAGDIGMVCGGQVVVCFQFLSGEDKGLVRFFAEALEAMGQAVDSWLVTQMADGRVGQMGLYTREKWLCTWDNGLFAKGKGLFCHVPEDGGAGGSADDSFDGSVDAADDAADGGRDMSEQDMLPFVRSGAMLSKGEVSYYVEPLSHSETVYVFGGGHVSQELVPVISHVGFRTVVFDDRPEFASPQLFPDAVATVAGVFSDVAASLAENLSIKKQDYVVIMTRGHQADFEVLAQTLKLGTSYIGVIGSRTKVAMTKERLRELGYGSDDIDRIHAPIGLPIGGETPAEIAISIAAELIKHRADAAKAAGEAHGSCPMHGADI
ncbi:MAG: XdhC family protein [Sphaerochaetaceae bacterium]